MRWKFVCLFLFICSLGIGQELCDDAIDNDGDGLIDINDPDCFCSATVPSGLIPNPSFEEMNCCPDEKDELECAVSWIQASQATTDYIHTCSGFLGHPSIPGAIAPLPLPDGEGAVGHRDGEPWGSGFYKEYTGSALIQAMQIGVDYRFDLYVGIPNRPNITDFEVAIFASDVTGSLPFGGFDDEFGCPSNGPNWDQLGSQTVSGLDEWINVVFEFTPTKAYSSIVIGPGCARNPKYREQPYFYLDRLALAQTNDFLIPFADQSGEVCNDDLLLVADEALSYQWYKNGIAMIAETNQTLQLGSNDEEALYQVMTIQEEGCYLSTPFNLQIPDKEGLQLVEICEGEVYELGDQKLTTAGRYQELLTIGSSCDSLAIVDLVVNQHTSATIDEAICSGDTLLFEEMTFDEEGSYEIIIPNTKSCDSVITLRLSIYDEFPNFEIEETYEINLGEKIDLGLDDLEFVSEVEWLINDELVSEDLTLQDYVVTMDTEIEVIAYSSVGCIKREFVDIKVDPTVKVYLPNIIDLDSNTSNDKFLIGTNLAVSEIVYLEVYDRWGSLVYEYSGDVDAQPGWDGTKVGKRIEQGVYTYRIELRDLVSASHSYAGTVMLLL